MSTTSSELRFLKECRGTAVSNGNSSYPRIRRARLSGAKRKHGILVKAEYRYLRSASRAALAFSDLDESLECHPSDDQTALILDRALWTLDTEWIESLSVLDRCGLFRNET